MDTVRTQVNKIYQSYKYYLKKVLHRFLLSLKNLYYQLEMIVLHTSITLIQSKIKCSIFFSAIPLILITSSISFFFVLCFLEEIVHKHRSSSMTSKFHADCIKKSKFKKDVSKRNILDIFINQHHINCHRISEQINI